MHGKKPQPGRMYRIGEAAKELNLQTSVLRFWEGEFSELQPVRTPKGQRLYTERDMEILRKIRTLLHEQGMTIEGARRVLSGASAPAAPAVRAESVSTPAAGQKLSAETVSVLQDALHELQALRVLLTLNNAEEKRS